MESIGHGVKPTHGIKLDTVGKRLRAERERLGLSQEDFGARCGVHRRTQVNYELDRRTPPFDYLDAIDGLGVDSAYVMSGVRVTEEPTLAIATTRFLFTLFEALGRADYAEAYLKVALEIEKSTFQMTDGHAVAADRIRAMAQAILEESPVVCRWIADAGEIDVRLLGEVLTAIEREFDRLNVPPASQKKGRLAAALYRSSKNSGTVDAKTAADLVALSIDEPAAVVPVDAAHRVESSSVNQREGLELVSPRIGMTATPARSATKSRSRKTHRT